MNHRWYERNPAHVDVVVHTASMGYIRGRIKNVSDGGVYIETAPGIGLHRNTLIKIAIPSLQQMQTLAAIVVRRDSGAFAAMFLDPVPQIRGVLLQDEPEPVPASCYASSLSSASE